MSSGLWFDSLDPSVACHSFLGQDSECEMCGEDKMFLCCSPCRRNVQVTQQHREISSSTSLRKQRQ